MTEYKNFDRLTGKEDFLIVLFSRTFLNHEVMVEAEKIIRSQPCWDYIVLRLNDLEIVPIFYFNLKIFEKRRPDVFKFVPASVVERLKKEYFLNASRNALVFKELKAVLISLKEAEIPAVVLKGAALAELVYQNRALRPMADIDILVKSEQLENAEKIIEKLGYSPSEDYSYSKDYYKNNHHHLIPYESENSIELEIHSHIIKPSFPLSLNIEHMWMRSESVTIAGVNTLVFSPEDMIVHLCLHFCQHFVSTSDFIGKLRVMCDISRVIERNYSSLCWEQIIVESRKDNMSHYVYYPLSFVADMLGVRIPDDFLKRMKRDVDPSIFEDEILRSAMKRYLLVPYWRESFVPFGFLKLISDKLLLEKEKNLSVVLASIEVFSSVIKQSAKNKSSSAKLMPFYMLYIICCSLLKHAYKFVIYKIRFSQFIK